MYVILEHTRAWYVPYIVLHRYLQLMDLRHILVFMVIDEFLFHFVVSAVKWFGMCKC